MANKWRTAVSEANAIFAGYGVSPSDLSTETLTRKWTGIDRSVLYTLITTLRATTTVTDPKADGLTYTGTWTVGSVDPKLAEGGNTAGSATIIQVLKKNTYTAATPDNLTIIRCRAYPLEQNENAWMYYERFKSEVTTRWHNIKAANISDEYDKIRQIRSSLIAWSSYEVQGDIPDADLYCVVYIDPTQLNIRIQGAYWHTMAASTYITPVIEDDGSGTGTWRVKNQTPTVLGSTIIRECWYEHNDDGTYNLFRTLETITSPAIMRTRALQYAGMTLVSGAPALDDVEITIKGFNTLTEVIYKDARFRIGSDTYRVTANTIAVAGVATNIPITPAISQATEDAADADPEQVQVFWMAL